MDRSSFSSRRNFLFPFEIASRRLSRSGLKVGSPDGRYIAETTVRKNMLKGCDEGVGGADSPGAPRHGCHILLLKRHAEEEGNPFVG